MLKNLWNGQFLTQRWWRPLSNSRWNRSLVRETPENPKVKLKSSLKRLEQIIIHALHMTYLGLFGLIWYLKCQSLDFFGFLGWQTRSIAKAFWVWQAWAGLSIWCTDRALALECRRTGLCVRASGRVRSQQWNIIVGVSHQECGCWSRTKGRTHRHRLRNEARVHM